jgi:hypothetical protein
MAKVVALVAAVCVVVCVSAAFGQTPAPAGGDEFHVVSTTPVANDGYDVKLRNPRTGYVHSVTIYIEVGITLSFKPGDRVRKVQMGNRIVLVPVQARPAANDPKPGPPLQGRVEKANTDKFPANGLDGKPLLYVIDRLGSGGDRAVAVDSSGNKTRLDDQVRQRSAGKSEPFQPWENAFDGVTGQLDRQ